MIGDSYFESNLMTKKRYKANASLLELDSKLEEVVLDRLANYKGHCGALESALGALILGRHYGWRVLRMAHSPATYTKYEKILGVEFKEICPETTELSYRATGMKIAKKLNAFWDVVMGRKKVENKGVLVDE